MKFGEQAFIKERSIGDSQNQKTAEKELNRIKENEAEKMLKIDALQDICDMNKILNDTWRNNRGEQFKVHDQKFVSFIFVGSSTGLFKIFPGWLIPDGFDPTLRPWYKKASQSVQMELMIYQDAFSETNRLSVSKDGLKANILKNILRFFYKRIIFYFFG